jgi:hypothetical protein
MDFDKNAQIIYRLRETTPYGKYSDSLYYTLDQWSTMTQEDLDTAIKERVDGWIKAITTPVEPYIPSKEDLESEVVRIEMQKIDAANRVVEYFPPKPIEEWTEEEIEAETRKVEDQIFPLQMKLDQYDIAADKIAVAKLAPKEEPLEAELKG